MKKFLSLDVIKQSVVVFGRIFKISWQTRKSAIIGYLFGSAIEISGMIVSLYATAKLGALLANFVFTGQTEGIWFWLWVDIASLGFTGLSFFVMQYFKTMLYFSIVRRAINDFMGSLCRVDIGRLYETDFRNLVNKIGGQYIWRLPNASWQMIELVYGIARLSAIVLLASQITWWIVPLIILFLIPSVIGESKVAKTQWFVWDTKGDFRHIFWGLDYLVKQAKSQMELRTFQASKFVLNKIDDMNKEFYNAQELDYKKASRFLLPSSVIGVIGTAFGSIILLTQLLAKTISLEKYLFLSGALLRISGAVSAVFGTITALQESLPFTRDFFKLIDEQPEINDKPNAKKLSSKDSPKIEFRKVSFTYPGKEQPVFSNLSFVIEPGQHIALVGENGSGKSTLIKLLMRFYLPDSGQILIDDVDINDVEIDSWYNQVATLFQDFNQYPLSVSDNISIGRTDQKPDQNRIEEAARFGEIKDQIKKYPYGWGTFLDASFKKGIEPSGGQWQRVALSRAFYRNAKMIILDEPTSAIDAKAEYEIFNNIFSHYKDKSALIVSHRFSTVRRANEIIVLDSGKIVERGTHKELMKNKKLYAELFDKQAEGYKD